MGCRPLRRLSQPSSAALVLFAAALARPGAGRAAPDSDGAAMVFAEARTICARDRGALWGRDLCGPILIVDPADRQVITNQAAHGDALKPSGAVFAGTLPDEVNVANTPTEWAGTRWTQLVWPVATETMNRRVTLAHELFHRIQPTLGLSRPEVANRHLDTMVGRYLLQLEWRALARALTAVAPADRRAAIDDALAFRRERYRLFPGAAAEEDALEINEGVPEYTGVKLGLTTPTQRTAYAVYDLARFIEAPSFVRSFAYATGPAYGLLLDQADPTWRTRLAGGRRLDQLLAAATGLPTSASASLAERALRYDDDGSLKTSEERRDRERQATLADFRARLVDGSVLTLPTINANYQFNPQTLVPLESVGTVYPTFRVVDDWGVLEVEAGGALVRDGGAGVAVSARGIVASHLAGVGWRLALKPGWVVGPGARPGDFAVTREAVVSTIPK